MTDHSLPNRRRVPIGRSRGLTVSDAHDGVLGEESVALHVDAIHPDAFASLTVDIDSPEQADNVALALMAAAAEWRSRREARAAAEVEAGAAARRLIVDYLDPHGDPSVRDFMLDQPPTAARIATGVGVDESTVIGVLDELVDEGVVDHYAPVPGAALVYQLAAVTNAEAVAA